MAILNRKKLILCVLTSALICGGGFLRLSNKHEYYSTIPIAYNQYQHPFIEVELENSRYPLEFRLGSKFPLFLNKKVLDKLNKRSHGKAQWQDLQGQYYESPTYLIPTLKIGNLNLTNVTATETLEENTGTVGKLLGGEYNVYLDFSHSRIIACDSISKLKTHNIEYDHWVQTPFEMNRGGIILKVQTDLGILRLSLSTTSTETVIKSSLVPVNQPHTSSSFTINKQNFGPMTFKSLEISDDLHEIDGFIGMDFLQNHSLYLDYSKKIAYIEPPRTYFERLPVTFDPCMIPAINAAIEGNTYALQLDLGSSFLCSLNKEILDQIQKSDYGTASWRDYKGNLYESRAYTISKIQVGNFTLKNVIVKQDRDDFHENVSIDAGPANYQGMLGLPFLEKHNLFLDFQHAAIYACSNYIDLQKKNLLSDELLVIPFTLHSDGILLNIETDEGSQRLILDTAATNTALRSPHPNFTSKFKILEYDFGAHSLTPINLDERFEYDGYLGMDFLLKYSLYIDYRNKMILLDLKTSLDGK
ncbi:MAG: hypothetical protein K2X08_07710 [Chlamydiales bacterium]|nr:hypothetical protein [Chlamydiales bacterium]MBY0529649.1 hypothetical protein [Rhabdochlamydiaceae bacterium]